ncbi:MAG: hypothetical protein MJZ76_03330 [Bacteroidales bacterium]|nr:hypothetical protein [Bacteroidales bacterium]
MYFKAGFWNGIKANETREGLRTMLDVSEVLHNSRIITDATEEQIIKDPFLKSVIKQGRYERCDENYINKKLDSLKIDKNVNDLCATYLLDKGPCKCDSIEKKYGVVALCPETIIKKDHLFKGSGFSLDKNVKYPLRYVTFKDILGQPCNSLIVIDPYLLSNRKEDKTKGTVSFPGLSNNLESLLDAILPQSADVEFHLTIVSSLEKGQDDVKRIYEKVKKCLKKIRNENELVVKLGFFYTEKGFNHNVESFHSRHILSNSFLVDSEDGFDLFDDYGYRTKNNPTVSIVFPRLYGNCREDMTKYENWIVSVKKHVENASDCLFYGTKENRLFELVD